MNTYTLTLCDTDGTLIAVLPEAPSLPRFMHLHKIVDGDGFDTTVELADDPAPADHGAERVLSFARIASSVWVDDDRSALFCRVVA